MKSKSSTKPSVLEIKPRQNRGKFYVVAILILLVSVQISFLINLSDNEDSGVKNYLNQLMLPYIPLLGGIYIFYWYKSGNNMEIFKEKFSFVSMKTKFMFNMLAMVVFLVLWSQGPGTLSLLVSSLVTTVPCVMLVLSLRLQCNSIEDEVRLARSQRHIAPGLARAFISFIENVVYGEINRDGTIKSKSYMTAKNDYKKLNRISSKDWISDKIVIPFLESSSHKGDMDDIKRISKNKGEQHSIALDDLTQSYEANGNPRQSVLNVVKIKTDEQREIVQCDCEMGQLKPLKRKTDIDKDRGYFTQNSEEGLTCSTPGTKIEEITPPPPCDKTHEKIVSWVNNYVVMAENRPLNALYEIRKSITEQEYKLQFRLYFEECKRLVESDPELSKFVHLYHYQDDSERGKFTIHLENIVKEIKEIKQTD